MIFQRAADIWRDLPPELEDFEDLELRKLEGSLDHPSYIQLKAQLREGEHLVVCLYKEAHLGRLLNRDRNLYLEENVSDFLRHRAYYHRGESSEGYFALPHRHLAQLNQMEILN